MDIEIKVSEEQDPSAALAEIIDTIATGEASLAGDSEALKEPGTNQGTPIISNGAGDAMSEDAVKPANAGEVKENGM